MGRFTTFVEKRRNHNTSNQKTILLDQLLKYKGQDDVFIQFANLDKFGINPASSASNFGFEGSSQFNTPLGIYSYPVDYMIDLLESRNTIFGYGRTYTNVFRADLSNVVILQDVRERDVDEALDTLQHIYGANDEEHLTIKIALNPYSSISPNGKMLFSATRSYQVFLEDIRESGVPNPRGHNLPLPNLASYKDEETRNNNRHTIKEFNTHIWRKNCMVMGIRGFYDKGDGIIHPNEPTQAVFFDKTDLTLLERVTNTFNNKVTKSKLYDKFLDEFNNIRDILERTTKKNEYHIAFGKTFQDNFRFYFSLKGVIDVDDYSEFEKASESLGEQYGVIASMGADKDVDTMYGGFTIHGDLEEQTSMKPYVLFIKKYARLIVNSSTLNEEEKRDCLDQLR